MAKIKITKEQAIMLENLNKPKILKITESQYKAILEYEALGEGDGVISQISNGITNVNPKAGNEFKQNVKSETKIKGIFEESEDLWKGFVNELYGLNESGNNLYEKLIKLMEACGYVENRKLSKSKFDGNKDMAKNIITSGLHKLEECGSPYMAMEHMENTYDEHLKQLQQQLTQEPTNQFSDEEKNAEIKRRRALELQRRGETGEITPEMPIKEEDFDNSNNQDNIIGFDILNYEPFKSLPDTRDEMGTPRKTITLPTPDGMGLETLFSKQDFYDHEVEGPKMTHKFKGYITQFKNANNGEEPIFYDINPDTSDGNVPNTKIRQFDNNQELNSRRELYNDVKASQLGLDEEGVDETTSMGGSGAVFGNQGGDYPVGKVNFTEEKIYEALDTLKKKVTEEETEEDALEESGGGIVEIDDCTKLNNNKEAQKGGCSTGAVDNVVTIK